LANAKPPNKYYQNQRERYTHRIMLEKAAQGYTVKEIAEQTGFTAVAVNNILRQPYAQQTLVDEIQRIHGVDEEVVEIIKKNVVKAAKLYETVLNDPMADRKDRMEAAERFLNRRYGKPTQPMSQGSAIDLNALSDDEIAKLLPTSGTGTTD
jgi:predicted transcriptional regulator